MAWSERKHICGHIPHMHTEGKSPGESISCETTIPGFLYCPETERMKNMKWGLVVIAAVFEVVWVT